MPSSDRFETVRDRSLGPQAPASGGPQGSAAPKAHAAPIEPPQYFDPSEPWDAQSAEALTRLYESGEASLAGDRRHEQPRRWQPPQDAPPGAAPEAPLDHARLGARLADVAQRMQEALAGLGTDKSFDPVNARLDRIEQRLDEALRQVAQRADLDGLRLIEANVMELAAHFEQTRGRLDRLDTIDDQVRLIARRLEETDHQQLAGLEKLLQDYMTEWRRGEERTANSLHSLEDTVSRIGDAVDAMEAYKPAPDLSLSMLDPAAGLGNMPVERDPLSQVYAEAEHAADDRSQRPLLDAADYAPMATTAEKSPPPAPAPVPTPAPAPPALRQADIAAADTLPSPAFRASAMRAKLRQAQLLSAEEAKEQAASTAAPSQGAAAPQAPRRARAGFLLAAAVTLCAAGGYLAVDVFMSASPRRLAPASTDHSARPAKAAGDTDTEAPDDGVRAGDRKDKAPSSLPQEGLQKALPTQEYAGQANPPTGSRFPGMEAIGSAIAAVFRAKAPADPPPAPQPAAATPKEAPPAAEDAELPAITSLPMTIGPASLRQAAMRGDAAAQFEIATRFATGVSVTRDLQQAFHWYARAATQGMALAQYRLAALHERGLGTPADPERARVWYGRAAEQGNVKAMHNLAVLSVAGGRSDYATAAKWFARAADFGLTDSQFNLAVLHQTGLGVPKDMKLAYTWLALAARFGDPEAAARVGEAKSRLGPAEVQAADAIVASWRARTPDPAANEAGTAALTMRQ